MRRWGSRVRGTPTSGATRGSEKTPRLIGSESSPSTTTNPPTAVSAAFGPLKVAPRLFAGARCPTSYAIGDAARPARRPAERSGFPAIRFPASSARRFVIASLPGPSAGLAWGRFGYQPLARNREGQGG